MKAPDRHPVAIQAVKDVTSPVKEWLEELVGQSLTDDDTVMVMVMTPHEEPTPEVRAHAAQELRNLLEKTAAHGRDIPQSEIDAAIDEAMQERRGR